MSKMAKVVLNENHSLLPEQVNILNRQFGIGNWEILPVPSEGWTLKQIREEIEPLFEFNDIVFASPVPLLMVDLARANGQWSLYDSINFPPTDIRVGKVWVFHNDNREAKEITLPNGKKKLIHTVAKTGWILA